MTGVCHLMSLHYPLIIYSLQLSITLNPSDFACLWVVVDSLMFSFSVPQSFFILQILMYFPPIVDLHVPYCVFVVKQTVCSMYMFLYLPVLHNVSKNLFIWSLFCPAYSLHPAVTLLLTRFPCSFHPVWLKKNCVLVNQCLQFENWK